jgi:hypothetical protein
MQRKPENLTISEPKSVENHFEIYITGAGCPQYW